MKKSPRIITLAYLELLVRKQEQKEEYIKKLDNYKFYVPDVSDGDEG
jgi:hypothetical protein